MDRAFPNTQVERKIIDKEVIEQKWMKEDCLWICDTTHETCQLVANSTSLLKWLCLFISGEEHIHWIRRKLILGEYTNTYKEARSHVTLSGVTLSNGKQSTRHNKRQTWFANWKEKEVETTCIEKSVRQNQLSQWDEEG